MSVQPQQPPPPATDGVDHRSRYLVAKNQGTCGSCTAYAMTGLLEGAVASMANLRAPLSDMHLWSRYHTPSVDDCAAAAKKGGIAQQSQADAKGMPYDSDVCTAWTEKKASPLASLVSELDASAQFEVERVDTIAPSEGRTAPSAAQLQTILASGRDVWVAMYTNDGWQNPPNGVVPDYELSNRGGHAVVLVGYRSIGGKAHFIMRNSWGSDWADAGYGYLSFDSLEKNLISALVISLTRKGGNLFAPICPSGQSADLANVCRALCADGFLANDAGQCPAPGATCGTSQVADAGGTCVAACAAGDRSGLGYKVSCTDRACNWTIDDGAMGCVGNGQPCTKNCPAPACAAITRKNELGQTIWGCSAPAL